jgi:hypothetical protein
MYNIESQNTESVCGNLFEAAEMRISREFFFRNESVQEEQRLSARWLGNVYRNLSDCKEAVLGGNQVRRSRPAAMCSVDALELFLLSYNSTKFRCNDDNLRLFGSETAHTLEEDKGSQGAGRDLNLINIEHGNTALISKQPLRLVEANNVILEQQNINCDTLMWYLINDGLI